MKVTQKVVVVVVVVVDLFFPMSTHSSLILPTNQPIITPGPATVREILSHNYYHTHSLASLCSDIITRAVDTIQLRLCKNFLSIPL